MKRYEGEPLDDYIDRMNATRIQRLSDAYAEGKSVGRMGLGAGLCPQGYGQDETDEWLRGFHAGAAELLTDRRAA